jgi:hypothetical protein
MTRRRLIFGLLLNSAALACVAGWLLVANVRKVTQARFERVEEGMSREEVIRTVGGPPGDYSRRELITNGWSNLSWYHDTWLCDDGELLVRFDDSGTATEVVVLDVRSRQPTLTEQIRRWLGL